MKLKKVGKLKDHVVISCAASQHCTALVSEEGKLFMFGNVEEDVVDKTTGLH